MMIQTTRYGFGTQVPWSTTAAIERVTAALKDEGFGILTTIDVQQTLKEKLGVDTEPYVILGACNPELAHQALRAEPGIGMLLPCNVIVHHDGGAMMIEIMDPEAAMSLSDNPAVAPVALQAKERLERVVQQIEDTAAST